MDAATLSTCDMTPQQYKEACKALGISVYASTKALCISLPQAQRYATGKAAIPEKIAKLLRALVVLGKTEV